MPQSAVSLSEKYPQYYKNVAHLTEVDVYQVHDLFGITDHSGALHHASKKLLLAGVRTGGKPVIEDIREARDSLTRYLDIQESKQPQVETKLVFPGISLATVNGVAVDISTTAPQAAAPAPAAPVVAKIVPSGDRWVILYYHDDADRRFRPNDYYVIAKSYKEAMASFREFFPKAESVWVQKVTQFKKGAALARQAYWATRG